MMVTRTSKTQRLHSVDWGVTQGDLSEVHNNLHCLYNVELQVVLTAPGHQTVNLQPVGRPIPIKHESNEGGVVRKLKEFE